MFRLTRISGSIYAFCAALLFSSGFLSWLSYHSDPEAAIVLRASSFICLLVLLTAATVSLRDGIISPKIRRYVTTVLITQILWNMLDALGEIMFPFGGAMTRLIWYLSYVPIQITAFFTMLIFIRVGETEEYKINRAFLTISIILSVSLVLMVISNDLHQFAFSFPGGVAQDFTDWETAYSYNTGYYLIQAWGLIMFLIGFITNYIKNSGHFFRQRLYIPLIGLTLIFLYAAGFVLHSRFVWFWDAELFSVAATDSFIWMLSFDMAERVGMVRANFSRTYFFEASDLSAAVADHSGEIRVRTKNMPDIPDPALIELAKEAPVTLESGLRLHAHEINGGSFLFTSDLSAVNEINAALLSARERLKEDSVLLREEIELNRRRVRAEEQNRLYTMLAEGVQPQLTLLSEMLGSLDVSSPDFKTGFARATVVKAYVKRHCNLELLLQEHPLLSAFELENSIRESMDHLRLASVPVTYTSSVSGKFDGRGILSFYEFYESVVEEILSFGGSIDVAMENREEQLSLTVTARTPGPVPKTSALSEALNLLDGTFTLREESGGYTSFLTLPEEVKR